MDVIVSDHIGFNLDTDAMHFGLALSPGGSKRKLDIKHNAEHALKVDITFIGEMADWVVSEENGFILEPDVVKPVEFIVSVPEGMEEREYTGKILIYFKKVI